MNILAITNYFNPFRGKLRRKNYEIFRKNLGIPLLTVEWSENGNFELKKEDSDYLVQISGGDLLWQKERLLNIGLAHAENLSPQNIVLLDCDVVFASKNWFEEVMMALQNFSFIQCYKKVDYLPYLDNLDLTPDALSLVEPELTLDALLCGMERSKALYKQADAKKSLAPLNVLSGNPGMAVAFRADSFQISRLYECNIVGGGDLVYIASLTNRLDELFSVIDYSPQHQAHIRSWQSLTFQESDSVGYAENKLMHLWHGDLGKRRYRQRYSILADYGYDPIRDLEMFGNGPIKFSQNSGELSFFVSQYLKSREDY